MIAITKDEKEIILKHFPNAHIARTMKQDSKRHHYYCEETRSVMRLLSKLRDYGQYSGGANERNNLQSGKRACR